MYVCVYIYTSALAHTHTHYDTKRMTHPYTMNYTYKRVHEERVVPNN